MPVTGKRADRIIIDDLCPPTPSTGIWVTDTGRTLADCKAKFDDVLPLINWPRPELPQTEAEFRRLYLCQWPPEDDGDQDTRL
jgi:hypothetical protein